MAAAHDTAAADAGSAPKAAAQKGRKGFYHNAFLPIDVIHEEESLVLRTSYIHKDGPFRYLPAQ